MRLMHQSMVLATSGFLVCADAGLVRSESDRASSQQFLYEESLRARPAPQPGQPYRPLRFAAPHRAPPTFRRILMQRATSDWRTGGERRVTRGAPSLPQHPDAVVAVYGDRFAQALAAGLEDGGDARIAVTPAATEDAGLTRSDFNEWLQSIRTRLARPDHPNLAVIMLGSNDRQPLTEAGVPVGPASQRWPALYGARVDAVAAAFHDAHVPLIWVGLPSVHSEEISADFVRFNGIVRDRVAQRGAVYVDSWEAFNDETGRYSPVGPDVEGQNVKLRKAEGFGFTRAGARKLASFVEGDLKRLRAPVVTAARAGAGAADITIETTHEFDQALQIDVNAQIRREAGLTPEASLPAGTAGSPAAPPKPAAGAVISLNAPLLSPSGLLAGAGARGGRERAPQDPGQAAVPKPGRADDFAWPRP